jgi:hypothetical protein
LRYRSTTNVYAAQLNARAIVGEICRRKVCGYRLVKIATPGYSDARLLAAIDRFQSDCKVELV